MAAGLPLFQLPSAPGNGSSACLVPEKVDALVSRVDALTDEVRVIAAGLRAIEERVANQVTLFGEQLQRFAAVNTAHEQAEKRSEEIATRLKELIGLMSRPKRGRRKAS